MISQKIILEYQDNNCASASSSSYCGDLLPKLPAPSHRNSASALGATVMADNLHNAINSLSLHDEEPVDLPDNPMFHVYEENAMSLLGRLLNPACQLMDKMIETMPRVWRVYNRVRGIALSRDKFQFVFQREEDMLTVLNDRPWSYNNWTILLDRWVPAPPANFLTTVDVWVRIRHIPMNHYRIETMDFLASKIGDVLEIAYDPKVSQKETYIRALVRLDIANPAIEFKPLNLPSGGRVIIEFEYEKLRKRCFHCHRLTHEKPSCPFVHQKVAAKEPQRRLDAPKSPPQQLEGPSSSKVQPASVKQPSVPGLSVPPGFAPLFPELPAEERAAALLYISHSDATECQARIERVQQSLTPGFVEPSSLKPTISHDLNKGKGHVFTFTDNERPLKRSFGRDEATTTSEQPTWKVRRNLNRDSDDQEVSSASSLSCPTVFRMGSSFGTPPSGTWRDGKKSRRRPQKWKRFNRAPHPSDSALHDVVGNDLSGLGSGTLPGSSNNLTKRKASMTAEEQSAKSSKPTKPSVASDLKPLPSQ
ncbi:uncharacterized protein LOC108820375 [Raphanus sativus]|uniref:Uncharacterized protein LOC108820375 n=1 Tax=Raphanus sativus TaxID=3726 RepID=A0A6J0KLT8_RAPSA|nr:uncharacterized protein LOC108820375 [Raphanus sativus]